MCWYLQPGLQWQLWVDWALLSPFVILYRKGLYIYIYICTYKAWHESAVAPSQPDLCFFHTWGVDPWARVFVSAATQWPGVFGHPPRFDCGEGGAVLFWQDLHREHASETLCPTWACGEADVCQSPEISQFYCWLSQIHFWEAGLQPWDRAILLPAVKKRSEGRGLLPFQGTR